MNMKKHVHLVCNNLSLRKQIRKTCFHKNKHVGSSLVPWHQHYNTESPILSFSGKKQTNTIYSLSLDIKICNSLTANIAASKRHKYPHSVPSHFRVAMHCNLVTQKINKLNRKICRVDLLHTRRTISFFTYRY